MFYSDARKFADRINAKAKAEIATVRPGYVPSNGIQSSCGGFSIQIKEGDRLLTNDDGEWFIRKQHGLKSDIPPSSFQPFLSWLSELDKEVQWRSGITIYDVCEDDGRLTKLFLERKLVPEAAKELINEIPSSAS